MVDEIDDEEFEDGADFMAHMEREEIASARAGYSNGAKLLRQHQFQLAAQYVALALCGIPTMKRIVLFGSVALPLKQEKPRYAADRLAGLPWVWHECADIDLAVWVDNLTVLKSLQRARGQALNFLLAAHGVGVAHHQVELFIMQPGTDKYLGRLCTFGTCPKGKPDCHTPGCGKTPYLKMVDGFNLHRDALDPAKSMRLYDADQFPMLRDSVLLPVLKG